MKSPFLDIFKKVKSSTYLKLLVFLSSFAWFLKFSGAALPIHFIKNNLSFAEIAFGVTMALLGQVFAVYFLSKFKFSNKNIWLASLLSYILVFSLYILAPIPLIYFIASFISGIASIFFYATYSVSHFEIVPRNKTGSGSAIFFNILILTGILTPIIAGFIAAWSIYALLALSILFALLVIYLSKFQENIIIDYSIKDALAEVKNVRWPIYLHGVHEALHYGIIPLFTLTLLSEFIEFGVFGTFLAIIGVGANFIVGHYSDKLKSKKRLLSVFAFLLGAISMAYAFPFFRETILLWAILNIVNGFIDQIYDQTSLAFIMDETKKRVQAIFGRELIMNLGRFSGMFLVFLGFLYEPLLVPVIILLGFSMIIFGIIVWRMQDQKETSLSS